MPVVGSEIRLMINSVLAKVKAVLKVLWTNFGLFLRNRRKMTLITPLTLILGAGLGECGKWVWDEYIQPTDYFLTVQAYDVTPPHKPLRDVTVGLHLKHGYLHDHTDNLGNVGITIRHENKGVTLVPEYQLDGYHLVQEKNLSLFLGKQHNIKTIVLFESEAAAKSVVTSTIRPNQPAEAGDANRARAGQLATTQEIYTSPSLPSGPGEQFSSQYTLCSSEKPSDWTIIDSSFLLQGDRSCGAWAVCEKAVSSPNKVCWNFRMQGHSEEVGLLRPGNTGIHSSTGVLTVKWEHPIDSSRQQQGGNTQPQQTN